MSRTFSDAAIQTCLTMKVLFRMALRQTTGFVESLLRLTGLDWVVPDFSTICRRQRTLAVIIPYRGAKGPLHLLIDSTGIKVEGEGEWNARKHGGSKRRVWRKIHIGIDEQTLEIRVVEITGSNTGDAPMLPLLLNQSPRNQQIGSVTAWRIRHAPMSQRHRRSWSVCGHPTTSDALSHGSQPPPVPSPGMTLCARQNIWAGHSGGTGADTTAGAASRQRCIA
jgi:hypothetical protein